MDGVLRLCIKTEKGALFLLTVISVTQF